MTENIKKLKLSVDKLEQRLRQAGIANISDVEWATLEVSGQLGYQLKAEKQPATKEDIKKLISLIETKLMLRCKNFVVFLVSLQVRRHS